MIVILLMLLLTGSYASALEGANLTAPAMPLTLSGWPAAVLVSLVIISYLARRLAKEGHFFHTSFGAAVLAIVTGLSSATAQAIQVSGFSASIVWTALIGAALSMTASSNPSVPVGQPAPMARKREGGFWSLFSYCLIFAVATSVLTGCPPSGSGAPSDGGKNVGQVLITDLGKCTIGEVPPTIQALIPDFTNALNGNAVSWDKELQMLEGRGIDVAMCIVENAIFDLTKKNSPHMAKSKIAEDRLKAAHKRFQDKRAGR